MKELQYQIALSLIPGIGDIAAKKLIAYCGGAEAIFKEKENILIKIPGIGLKGAKSIASAKVLDRAEEELRFIEDNKVKALFYLDKDYPKRLLHCEDSPILIYVKGNIDLNRQKHISFVGTRNATVKGKIRCEKIIEELSQHDVTIISGLAYGIDITAHKAALKYKLPTIGVVGSSLDNIYPKSHFNTAKKMEENGAIISDYISKTKMLPVHFAERNRIVAGISDATVVIESAEKGGSLITADLANGYNRDVFAIPGRPEDSQSIGCNKLIKSHKAALIESAADIEYILGWEKDEKKHSIQQELLLDDFTAEEQKILHALKKSETKSIDIISIESGIPMSKTSPILLNLEFKGVIQSLPGKMYRLI